MHQSETSTCDVRKLARYLKPVTKFQADFLTCSTNQKQALVMSQNFEWLKSSRIFRAVLFILALIHQSETCTCDVTKLAIGLKSFFTAFCIDKKTTTVSGYCLDKILKRALNKNSTFLQQAAPTAATTLHNDTISSS